MLKNFFLLLILSLVLGCSRNNGDDMFSLAKSRQSDLQFGIYITAHSVEQFLSTPAGRREARPVVPRHRFPFTRTIITCQEILDTVPRFQ